jgi:hypothetical protein
VVDSSHIILYILQGFKPWTEEVAVVNERALRDACSLSTPHLKHPHRRKFGCCDLHSSTWLRIAWFGSSVRAPAPWNLSPVMGDVSARRIHCAIAPLEYVWPSTQITGSSKTSWVIGHKKFLGTPSESTSNCSTPEFDMCGATGVEVETSWS